MHHDCSPDNDLAAFFESNLFGDVLGEFTSGEVADALGVVRTMETETVSDIVDGKKVLLRVAGNPAAVFY